MDGKPEAGPPGGDLHIKVGPRGGIYSQDSKEGDSKVKERSQGSNNDGDASGDTSISVGPRGSIYHQDSSSGISVLGGRAAGSK